MKATQTAGRPAEHWANPVTWVTLPTAALLATSIVMIFFVAPREMTMGDVQRIVYIHVAVAWCGLAGILIAGAAGVGYLWTRTMQWDSWAQAAAEIGWLCSLLTLITGSLWAHEAWNTWWTWEPRLTSMLILWTIYSGYLLLRSSLDDPHQRARLSAVVSLLGVMDVPLIVMATRMFRGIHPVSPQMDATMRIVLLTTAVAFSVFFAVLLVWRQQQIALLQRLTVLENSSISSI